MTCCLLEGFMNRSTYYGLFERVRYSHDTALGTVVGSMGAGTGWGNCAAVRRGLGGAGGCAAHGNAYSTVQVDQFLATPLKGEKTEYDLMGTTEETCTRSIFPQKWHPPCWWLKRHTSQWE